MHGFETMAEEEGRGHLRLPTPSIVRSVRVHLNLRSDLCIE